VPYLKPNQNMKTQTLEQQLAEQEKIKQTADKKAAEISKKIEAEKNKNKPKSIMERIGSMADVFKILGASKSKDVIKIDKFDKEEHAFIENIIAKVRICKAYGEGKRLTKSDRRYYNWYDVSSGFAVGGATYDNTLALTISASRLCFDSSEKSMDAFKKFPDVEKGIILG